MGYSGIIGFILRNKHRKAAYNHFESEPDRQGHWIAQFIIGLSPEQCLEMADLWIEEENHRDLVSDEIKERYLAFDGKWKYEFPHVGPQLWLYKDHLGGRYKEKIGKIIQCEEAQAAEELEERRKTYLKHFEEYGYSRYRKTWHDVLCRAQGAESLRLIQQGKLSHLLEKMSHIYDANWAYFIDFHHQKMEVWAEDVLVREVTFDMLRGNPDYMLDFDWFKMRDTDWYKRPDTHWYYKDEDSDEDVF